MKRIYVVTHTDETFLVKAATQAEAIRIIVQPRYKAEVASQEQLIALIQKGTKVQEG